MKIDDVDEYGEGVREVLEKEPAIFFRIGSALFFTIILLMLFFSWLVRYPDIIQAPVVITHENPPIKVVAKSNGYLTNLNFEDKDDVKAGDILAVLDNTARWSDIKMLEAYIGQVKETREQSDYLKLPFPPNLTVGDIQDLYALLSQSILDYQYYLKQTTVQKKIKSLEAQIMYVRQLVTILQQEEETLRQQADIAKKDLDRNKKLYSQKVISDTDLENKELYYLEYRRKFENIHSQVVTRNIEAEQLETTIIDISRTHGDQNQQKILTIKENLERLASALDDWKKRNLIHAPIAGKLSMSSVYSKQQFITANQEIFTIVPNGSSGKIIGKARLSNTGAGKVKPGMLVNIRLKEFPAAEFGVIRAKVNSISLVADNDTYMVALEVPPDFTTTYNKAIPFTPGMQGQAGIVTEKYNLLQRLFFRVMDIAKNK